MAKKPDLYEKMKAMSAGSKPAGAAEIASITRQTIENEKARASETVPAPEPQRAASSRELTALAKQTVDTFTRESETTRPRENVSTHGIERPKGFNVRPPRIEKPHQSVYAHPKVFAVLRQIAAAEDKKPQDLYKEGLRAVLSKRGYDFDKLDKGEDV